MNKGRNTFLLSSAVGAVVLVMAIPAFMSVFYGSMIDVHSVLPQEKAAGLEAEPLVPLALVVRDRKNSKDIDRELGKTESGPIASPESYIYRDRKSLGGRSLMDISDSFDLVLLKEQDDYLIIDDSLKGIIERIYDVIPAEELRNGQQMLEAAAALNINKAAAKEFKETVVEYVSYKEKMAALDEELNAMNFKPGDGPSTESLLAQLQDEAFGYEKALALFRVERALNHAMANAREEYQVSAATMKREDWDRINGEYRAIIEEVRQTN